MASGSMMQRSFSGGELAEAMAARADQVKYQTGAKLIRNWIVRRHGGLSNRCGSQYICSAKDHTIPHAARRFVFNADQTYVLLFGHLNLRIVRQGVLLTVSGVAAWSNATAYAVGALVVSGGVNYYCIVAHTNQAPPNAAYWYAMPAGNIYEIPTPFASADIATLYLAQSGDVVSIDHRNYAPRELRRTGHTSWTLVLATVTPGIARPVGVSATFSVAGSKNFRYRVTAQSASGEESLPALGPPKTISGISQANPCVVTANNHQMVNGDEVYIEGVLGMTEVNGRTFKVANTTVNTMQLEGIDSRTFAAYSSGGKVSRTSASTSTRAVATNITAATQALPCQVTSAGHGLATGDTVYIASIVGMVELNGGSFTVTVVNANTITLDGVDSTAYTAYASGGTLQKTNISTAGDPTSASPHVITWTPAAGATLYHVYREINGNGVYGYIGAAVGTSFNDTNSPLPDQDQAPPEAQALFAGAGDYPATVGYFGQRRMHGNTANSPETIFASRPGQLTNFSVSSPLQDGDAATWTLVGRQVNEVRHIVDIGTLVVLTSGSEWAMQGDGAGVVTPSTPGGKQYSYNGSSEVPPIVIGSNLLYIQARGNLVRDFRNTITQQGTQGYLGDDLTVFSSHLFEGVTLVTWAFQQIPNSMIYAVRSDGKILPLTYLKEHEIAAWSAWDTQGAYEDVCVVPEGSEDAVYVWVKRTIQGQTRRYLERFPSRVVTDVAVDARFLDSYLTYDGRNTSSTTMTLSGGTAWNYTEQLTLTASAGYFVAGDVGKAIRLSLTTTTVTPVETTSATVSVMCVIEAYQSATVVKVRPETDVEATLRGVALTSWARAVNQISGADHLEGASVGILADGQVVTNGIDGPVYTIVAGQLSAPLDRHYVVIHVGLAYVSDLQTLDLEVVNGETLSDKQKRVGSVTLTVEQTRGLKVGESVDGRRVDVLREIAPDVPNYGEPIAPVTGKLEVRIDSSWNAGGRIWVRQDVPLPATILGVTPHVTVGG